VIALPIPSNLSTLSFGIDEPTHDKAIMDARNEVLMKLPAILTGQPQNIPGEPPNPTP
jgi:hypothetical protein